MWDPITTVEQLVARFENSTLDYKATYDLSKPEVRYDIAKDIAAFANAYGGTIVVGVFETGGRAVRLDGVTDVPRLTGEVVTALRQYCVPLPPTPEDHAILVKPPDAARLLAASGASSPTRDVILVTLKVRAEARAPIGVRPFDAKRAGPMAETYRFPVRVVDHTDFLDPTELPMWMNSHERRIAIRLREVPTGAVVRAFQVQFGANDGAECLLNLAGVDEREMVAVFRRGSDRAKVPLVLISAIWQDPRSDQWSVKVEGTVFPEHTDGYKFRPRAG